MSRLYLLTAVCVLLCVQRMSAQERIIRVLTLDEVFRLAEENSKQLKLSAIRVETARRATSVVRNSRLPSIDASLSFSYIGDGTMLDRDLGNSMRAEMPHFGNNFAFDASLVVFAGGAISNSITKAKLEEQLAQLDYERNRMDVRFLLTGHYLNLYKLKNQREVYVKNIEQTQLLIRQIKAKQQEGMALNNDITRHELALQSDELALIEIDNNRDILNHQLITTLGLPATTAIEPDPNILGMELTGDGALSELMLTAEFHLPELRTASTQVQIADKGVKLAKADYLPSVAIVAANHFDGPILIEVPPIDKNFNYWYVGVGLKYNLSSLFKTKKNVRLAKAQQGIALEAREIVTEHTEVAIHADATKYKESFEKLAVFEKNLQLASENYRIVNNRYLNSLVLITEILDAANTKLNAELQVVNAKINIIYQYYKLQRTIGNI